MRRMSLAFWSVAILICFVMAAFALSLGGQYLSARILSAADTGSSIYTRFTAPLRLLVDVYTQNLLGLPLNDPTFLYTRPYLVDFAGRQFFRLDNFYIWILIYLGVPGACGLLWLLSRLAMVVGRNWNSAPLMVLALFAGATGGGYSAVFVLPFAIALSYARDDTPASAQEPLDQMLA